jgi:hypothetical protein
VFWDRNRSVGEEPLRSEQLKFIGLDPITADGYRISPDTEHHGDKPSRGNRYLQHRDALRKGTSFSGLPGLIEEDVAVSVSAGPIRDRSKSMLSGSDIAVARLLRTLLKCVRQVAQGGEALGSRANVAHIAGVHGELHCGDNWRSLVPAHRPAVRDPSRLQTLEPGPEA